MSTLTVPAQRSAAAAPDVDARFEALTHAVRQVTDAPGVEFGQVFDFDYGQGEPARRVRDEAPAAVTRIRRVAPAAAPVRPMPRVRPARPAQGAVRLTRRGRVVLSALFLAGALAAMVALGGWAAASLSGGHAQAVRIVEVHSGDTLYDIAGRVAEPGHVREMVLRIQQLNSLPGASIEEGQKLAVPAG